MHKLFGIFLLTAASTFSQPAPEKSISAPDTWWMSLEGKERQEFIQSYVIVQSYFMDELKFTFEDAVTRIEKLTEGGKKQSIHKLRDIVHWTKAQNRLLIQIEFADKLSNTLLTSKDSVDQVLAKINQYESLTREGVDAAMQAEQQARDRMLEQIQPETKTKPNCSASTHCPHIRERG